MGESNILFIHSMKQSPFWEATAGGTPLYSTEHKFMNFCCTLELK